MVWDQHGDGGVAAMSDSEAVDAVLTQLDQALVQMQERQEVTTRNLQRLRGAREASALALMAPAAPAFAARPAVAAPAGVGEGAGYGARAAWPDAAWGSRWTFLHRRASPCEKAWLHRPPHPCELSS